MKIEELVDALAEKHAGLLQTANEELWAEMPDGRRYYLGVQPVLFQASLERFKKTSVYLTLGFSEEELAERKALKVAQFLLSDAGLDLAAYSPYARMILPRILRELLDEVYGDQRSAPYKENGEPL